MGNHLLVHICLRTVCGRRLRGESMETLENQAVCIICGKPATQLVDGDPSCEEHIELVYENQSEDYTRDHMKENDWLKA